MSHLLSPARPPTGIVRIVTRFPLPLFRLRLGWLFGRRVLLLSHRGRTSGRLYQTPLEVIYEDRATGELFVMSGWGAQADWYRNLRASPAAGMRIGIRRHAVATRLLDPDEGAAVIAAYCRKHGVLAKLLARWGLAEPSTGGSEQLRRLAEAMPVVGLRVPAPTSGI